MDVSIGAEKLKELREERVREALARWGSRTGRSTFHPSSPADSGSRSHML